MVIVFLLAAGFLVGMLLADDVEDIGACVNDAILDYVVTPLLHLWRRQ